jgi:hypothetical protein
MKLCPHCSKSLEEDAVKCRRCGKWLIPVRDIALSKKRRRSDPKRLLIFGGVAILAYFVWAMPDGSFSRGEILNLKPDRQTALRAMRGDLGRLVGLEESYREMNGVFTANPRALGFASSESVSVSIIATPDGWSATARHEGHPPALGCAVFGGSSPPPQSPVTPEQPGTVACTRADS